MTLFTNSQKLSWMNGYTGVGDENTFIHHKCITEVLSIPMLSVWLYNIIN
jgi:hypothetical protein